MSPELTSRRNKKVDYEGDVVQVSDDSEVVHIPLEEKTACNYFKVPGDRKSIPAESAAEKHLLCDDCAESFDPATGLSAPYYRKMILDELDVDRPPEASAFDKVQLREIYLKLTE